MYTDCGILYHYCCSLGGEFQKGQRQRKTIWIAGFFVFSTALVWDGQGGLNSVSTTVPLEPHFSQSGRRPTTYGRKIVHERPKDVAHLSHSSPVGLTHARDTVLSLDPVATRAPYESIEKMPLRVGWRSSVVHKSLGPAGTQRVDKHRTIDGGATSVRTIP